MASNIKVTVIVEKDGVMIEGFPLFYKASFDETQRFDGMERATGASYVALPSGELDTIQLLCLRADKTVSLRLNGQSDAGLTIVPNGFVLLAGVTINAGAATNALLQNNSGATTVVTPGIAAGT